MCVLDVFPPDGVSSSLETACIEVTKIYDQCIVQQLIGQCVRAADFCPVPIPPGSQLTSQVLTNTARCFFVGLGPFQPPFFRAVRVLTRAEREVTVIDPEGTLLCSFTVALQEIVRGNLWVPEGTLVQCQVLNVGGGGCELTTDPVTGEQQICCRVNTCTLIQVKAPVNLLVSSAGFCQPQPCTGGPAAAFPCPPEQIFAPQTCPEPPVFTLKDEKGNGIGGVTISLLRTVDATTFTLTQTTDSAGQARFSDAGAFAGGFDEIRFVDPLGNVSKSFRIPGQFTDDLGFIQNSATACQIEFQRTEAGSNLFYVTINGRRLANPV